MYRIKKLLMFSKPWSKALTLAALSHSSKKTGFPWSKSTQHQPQVKVNFLFFGGLCLEYLFCRYTNA
jgi:hypothetical protein